MKCEHCHVRYSGKMSNNHMLYHCTECQSMFKDKDHWNTINDPMELEPFRAGRVDKKTKPLIQKSETKTYTWVTTEGKTKNEKVKWDL